MHDGQALAVFWAGGLDLCHIHLDGYEASGLVGVDGLSWHVGWRQRGIEVEGMEIGIVCEECQWWPRSRSTGMFLHLKSIQPDIRVSDCFFMVDKVTYPSPCPSNVVWVF